jgi:hypothetical protein
MYTADFEKFPQREDFRFSSSESDKRRLLATKSGFLKNCAKTSALYQENHPRLEM